MKQLTGDLWDLHHSGSILVITTNGFVKRNGECVMGRGIANQAAKRFPWLPARLGAYINQYGNRAFSMGAGLATMPVKPEVCDYLGDPMVVSHMRGKFSMGDTVPGWACVADFGIIERSAKELAAMADKFGWTEVLLPRPGCGAGELSWNAVGPLLDEILDARFACCTFS